MAPLLIAHEEVFDTLTNSSISVVGSVITTEAVAVHPLASVTNTLYVPAANPVAVVVIAPLDQMYV